MSPPCPSMPAPGRVPATWKTAPRARVIADVSAALLNGCVLITATHTVGRRCLATLETLEFECVDRQGNVEPSLEVEEHARGLYQLERTETQDWTAFGAAVALVNVVGQHAAERSLRALAAKRPPAHVCASSCTCRRCVRRAERTF